jgi:predicted component of type VI protein secretion system
MREDITEAIQTYEPRATVLEVEVKKNIDLNSVMINIFFSIDENPQVQELSFNVERIR